MSESFDWKIRSSEALFYLIGTQSISFLLVSWENERSLLAGAYGSAGDIFMTSSRREKKFTLTLKKLYHHE